jgi:hypothetical protein
MAHSFPLIACLSKLSLNDRMHIEKNLIKKKIV